MLHDQLTLLEPCAMRYHGYLLWSSLGVPVLQRFSPCEWLLLISAPGLWCGSMSIPGGDSMRIKRALARRTLASIIECPHWSNIGQVQSQKDSSWSPWFCITQDMHWISAWKILNQFIQVPGLDGLPFNGLIQHYNQQSTEPNFLGFGVQNCRGSGGTWGFHPALACHFSRPSDGVSGISWRAHFAPAGFSAALGSIGVVHGILRG